MIDPKKYGANTSADVGVLLVGLAAGGLVDALLNTFGFAEPMVVAPFTGAAALGLKKLLWDSWSNTNKRQARSDQNGIEETSRYGVIRAEIEVLEIEGRSKDAGVLKKALDIGIRNGLDVEQIRDIHNKLPS